jgi:rhodanese-related sulfurtransferase
MALTKEMVLEQMKKGAAVLNVLDEPAYADLHIKGSFNIPLKGKSDDEFAMEVQKKLGKGRMIVTHCANITCALGPRASVILNARGFKADDFPGGMEEWYEAGLPAEGRKVMTAAN